MSCPVCQLPLLPAALDRECPFCLAVFSRVDAARRHAKCCPQKGDLALPTGVRGRKVFSCDRCSHIKVYCNAPTQNPCGRCTSRKLACTFSRCCTDVTHRRHLQTLQTAYSHVPSQRCRNHRVPVSFLLNSTDERQDFITEQDVGEEPDSHLVGPICVAPLRVTTPEYIDPTLLLPFNDQLSELWNGELEAFNSTFPSFPSHEDILATRLELLESHVAAHHTSHFRGSFDKAAFRRFFDVSNVYKSAATFCRKRHYRYPIIHWPTFALEEASLPLLMVISLTGASYSYRPEDGPQHINNARNFYLLADSYVYDRLDACLESSPAGLDIKEAIQLCQAALLMYGLDTLLAGDLSMQHKAITQRRPALISAIRRLNFIGTRHGVSETWQTFLQQESIIRLVSWTFCTDCLATLAFNQPPLFSLLEMNGDLPCDPMLWDADSATNLEHATSSHSSYRLKDIMSSFLSDLNPLAINQNLPLFHLHITLCAFQQVIFNTHISMLLHQQSSRLLQSLTSWQTLWDQALQKLHSTHRSWLGVARYVPSLAVLSRRVIEVAVSPKADASKYLQRLPSHSMRDIHEFIRDLVAET